MAWLEKKEYANGKRTWFVRFRNSDGSKGSRVLGVGLTKREAQQLLLEFERKQSLIASGLATPELLDCNLSEFIERYRIYSEMNKAASTALRDHDVLRRLFEFVGDLQLREITRAMIESYISKRIRGVRPGTVNVELRHMKAAFNQAIRWELLERNPVKGIRLLKIPQSDVPKYLEKEQIDRLLDAMQDDPLLPLVKFYLFTGARLREGLYLQGEDVDLKRKIVFFRGRWTKNKRNRIIPFGQLPELQELLERQSPEQGRPVFPSSEDPEKMWCVDWISRRISRVFNKIGIPWATTHTLRHTFASHLVMQGVELFTVSRLLGHSSVTITEQHYAHLAPAHAEQALAKLPYR
ncbi:MAG: tyrosine-type recombinase/integrase [bacterium]